VYDAKTPGQKRIVRVFAIFIQQKKDFLALPKKIGGKIHAIVSQ